jgi:hypothetical protein
MRDSVKALVMTLSLAGAACGSSSGGKDTSKFVGVWSPASGVYTQTCPGDASNTGTSQVTSTETWATGTTSDLVQTIPGSSCVLHADISANTATATPSGQTCSIPAAATNGDSLTQAITLTAYNFVVSTDGLTATENYSGTLVLTDNTAGASENCTFTQTASYSKQ